jgi:alcohol dehydrogenase
VQIAKNLEARVIACASSAEKLRRLRELGADHVIDYTKEDFSRRAWEISGKQGVDVLVNYTGGDTWVPSLRTLARHGRLLTCGATAGFDPKEDLRFIWTFELKILGSNGWMREDLDTLIALIQQGRLVPVIDRELPLEEVNEAFRLLEDREVFGKVVVRP